MFHFSLHFWQTLFGPTKIILHSLMLPPRCGCLSVFHLLDPCRGSRYVVPKRRKQASELRCTTSQKSEAVKSLLIHDRYLGTNSWICCVRQSLTVIGGCRRNVIIMHNIRFRERQPDMTSSTREGGGKRVQITGARKQNMLHVFWYCQFLRMPLLLIEFLKYVSLF
jgi:hypothetical protein